MSISHINFFGGMIMKHVLYALTGDPVHRGHLNLIERLSRQYEKVTVDVAINELKNPLFTNEERINMIKHNIGHLKNVKITESVGMLISYADKIGAEAIIKYIRDPKDWEYEKIGIRASQTQGLNHIEFIAYFADKEYEDISSSISKGIFFHQGDILEFVPMNVKYELERKMKNQYFIGVTGGIGSGKDYISNKLAYNYESNTILPLINHAHIIDFDKMVHDMYSVYEEPRYIKMRNKIVDKFSPDILIDNYDQNYFIDRKKLSKKIEFEISISESNNKSNNSLIDLERIVLQPLLELYKEKIYGLEGLIILNCPLMVKSGLNFLCNNNVVLVNCDTSVRRQRLYKRGINFKQVEFFMDRQFSHDTIKCVLEMNIRRDKFGNIFEIDNSEDNSLEHYSDTCFKKINELYTEIIRKMIKKPSGKKKIS